MLFRSGITYHATGAESITQPDVAAAIAKVSGKPVKFTASTEAQQRAGLEAAGLPAHLIKGIICFGAAGRAGAFDVVTGDVQRLSGKAPARLEQYLYEALS